MYVRKEAVLSSQIEGTQSSLQDLLAAEAKLYNPDAPKTWTRCSAISKNFSIARAICRF
jgi:Fic family protein